MAGGGFWGIAGGRTVGGREGGPCGLACAEFDNRPDGAQEIRLPGLENGVSKCPRINPMQMALCLNFFLCNSIILTAIPYYHCIFYNMRSVV